MEAFVCKGCGAKLPDPMGASFVTCSYCKQATQVAAPSMAPAPPPAPQQIYIVPAYPQHNPAAHAKMMYLYIAGPILLALLGGVSSAISQCNTQRAVSQATAPATPTVRPAATQAAAPTPPAGPPVLKPSAPSYTVKQSAVIQFERMPSTTHAWISIAKAGTDAHSYLTYQYVESPSGSITFPLASYPPGAYLIRAYADSGYTMIGEVPVTITRK